MCNLIKHYGLMFSMVGGIAATLIAVWVTYLIYLGSSTSISGEENMNVENKEALFDIDVSGGLHNVCVGVGMGMGIVGALLMAYLVMKLVIPRMLKKKLAKDRRRSEIVNDAAIEMTEIVEGW